MCRYQAWKVTAQPCHYCGCPADTVDHVPPRCARPLLVEAQVSRWPFVEVEACRECNSALGNRTIWTLSARKEFVKAWLRRRYARYLKVPPWSDEELAEIGPTLKTVITEAQVLAALTRKRLAW